MERVQKRIGDWKTKWLSFVGRLQLVLSVIGSMHVYWASVFILPAGIIHDIEQLMCGFLWCQGEMKRGRAKVSWDDLCLPKKEGGLGVRKLEKFTVALMSSHIWKILTHKETLWVRWIHSYKLKNRSFWDIPMGANISWDWRKLLSIRPLIRHHIWHKIGNGRKTSVWFDKWDNLCPLMDHITNRAITSAGLDNQTMIADVVVNNTWT